MRAYYSTLNRFSSGHFDNEGNIRGAFETLLKKCAVQYDWTIVPEYQLARKGQSPIRIDAALLDSFNLPRGYWEAKDEKDTLVHEMEKKFRAGYPHSNIIFQRPSEALLYQDGRIAFHDSIKEPKNLVTVLHQFYEWRQPDHDGWDRAVTEFSARIPEIARGALKLINDERRTNRLFVERFAAFAQLCRESINPDLKEEAVEEMLVQHLLTERIFRRIFDNPEFTHRNVIAAEIEKVIDSLTKKHFSRDSFLRDIDPFYKAIEEAAASTESYAEKQAFLNKVYERFFQGFNRKQADTHGIVYTPQPIVDFMVRSVEEVLRTEFGRSLSDTGVHILDPFVGTGNFITRVMQEIKTSRLPQKYKEELHCNEVMLLPYYIASMNIEHAYLDRTCEYEPFEGICLVDTFELAEPRQAGFEFMNEGNTARIRKQKRAPIFVVVGNPPYNMGQVNENDQNKNRKYKHMDARVKETYTRASKATLRNKLSDPYVKAFRLASDRIRAGGMVAFVSNDSFVDQIAFDGMRKCLVQDFDKIYVIDLGGNVRKNPKLSGTTHNVFGIQVGVAITILIKKTDQSPSEKGRLYYAAVGSDWKKEQKFAQLDSWETLSSVKWNQLEPDERYTWLTQGEDSGFEGLISIGNKETKGEESTKSIFRLFSLGVATNRDDWVYGFIPESIRNNIEKTRSAFEIEQSRYVSLTVAQRKKYAPVIHEDEIKWTDRLILAVSDSSAKIEFDNARVRHSLYRPFVVEYLYFDHLLNQRRYQQHHIYPVRLTESENLTVAISGIGSNKPFQCLATNKLVSLDFLEKTQCFPFYIYDIDGTNRRENITDWALAEFRVNYGDKKISKWNIFYYTYALLHHPEYRTRYAANLKRELPHIPMAPEFRRYAETGAKLMKLHIDYEQQPEFPLKCTETGKLDWSVEKMTLSKDKTQLRYNGFLTFSDIPSDVYEYRLGNRSALEWVIDQYRISTDKRSGIVNNPNRPDDPEYIVRLIGQVVTVSLETVRLVRELARLPLFSRESVKEELALTAHP